MGAAPVIMMRTFPPRPFCSVETKGAVELLFLASFSTMAGWVKVHASQLSDLVGL